jgi:hypothetical protein
LHEIAKLSGGKGVTETADSDTRRDQRVA